MYMPEAYQDSQKYGYWKVVYTSKRGGFGGGTRKTYYVTTSNADMEPLEINTGKTGRKLARTLAAALEAADVTKYDEVLPPELGPSEYADDEWESWVGKTNAIPAKVASGGKAAIAGYMKVVHQQRESWIASRLGVSEQTVRQYLSDLREGRR